MTEETTPDEKKDLGTEAIERLWKAKQINFGQYRMMMNRAMRREFKPPKPIMQEIILKVDLVRNFPCSVCKKTVTATKILRGYLLVCDCIPAFSEGKDLDGHPWWDKVE